MQDPHRLQRFVDAQDGVYPQVLRELRAGRKESHWMWFIFPQFAGLGRTTMARRYAIWTVAEARAYTDHPVLGPRLMECTRLVVDVKGRSIEDIFGFPDHLKFRSCMTLFAHARPDAPVFLDALAQFFNSEVDIKTIVLLNAAAGAELRPSI